MSVTFTVYGEAVPQGSMRFLQSNTTGRIIPVRSGRLAAWRQMVSMRAREAGLTPADGPVSLDVRFVRTRPKSARRRPAPHVRPDLDKLVRAIFDALTGVAYRDDAQVVRLLTEKVYGDPPCVVVTVNPRLACAECGRERT